MRWLKQLLCDHAWRKPLPLVNIATGEPLTGAKRYCRKCGKSSRKELPQ